MARRLTTFSKLLITVLIVGALFWGFMQLKKQGTFDGLNNNSDTTDVVDNSNSNNNSNNSNTTTNSNTSSSGDADIKVQIFTWGGYAPGLYFNEGAEASTKSRFYKDYGLKVEFILIDDFDGSRNAWIADEVDLLGQEVTAMNTEMEKLGKYNPKIPMQVDWSRGGDAVIVRREIKTVNDLRGQKVAYAPFTPSETFLIFMLESAGMTIKDITPVEVQNPIDAATAFKGGKVAAAVVWSPDDIIATRDVPGSRVLQTTREASNIIADVFMVKDKFIRNNREKMHQFYEGWMKAAAEINTNKSNKEKAARILGQTTGLPTADAMGMIDNVYFTTHGDNLNFFGQNPNFKGMKAEALYTKMGREFEKLNRAPTNRPTWRQMAYTGAISSAELSGGTHNAEGQKDFKPVTEKVKSLPAIATKPVTINFPTGKFQLSENAKTIIDLQFAEIARSYANTRIRIEGNTDNVGSRANNKSLSLKRANAVAKYLKEQYQMSPNRLIVVGNGPDKPVAGCEDNASSDCKAKNRRTDFQLVAE